MHLRFSIILIALSLTACGSLQRGPASIRTGSKISQHLKIDWPVDRAKLSQKFKPKGSKKHWGVDLAAKRGTPILAAHNGKVVYAGRGFSGYGKLIILEYGTVWASFYSHLDKILVSQGDQIVRGEKIGLMGSTGRSSGPHLHFELRRNRKPVNPLAYLP